MNRANTSRWVLQALFVLSGCAALIYQSIWSHYLGLILGHAAYAQALVLAMFMGGMALGAWVISRMTQSLRRPIAVYAGAEAVIGLMGLIFHAVFLAYSGFSQASVLPGLSSAGAATAWQWLSSAALIAPQTVLLGSTFPLIAAGVLRLDASQQSRTLGGLYFTNSLGAALGALIATFALLPMLGMPGALKVAGWLNLVVAVFSGGLSMALREGAAGSSASAAPAQASERPGRLLPALLAATLISSAASFAYELGWVRMLNQALGTSLHSFELMLASFIAGLALGGLWVRRFGDRIADQVRYAGFVQVAMGLCAMLSVALLGNAYYWVPVVLNALARTDAGYVLYNVATAGIAILIMAPTAFLAGMTLPLFTAALLRKGAGERAVGQVYAANTLGAILGVVIAAHLLMPTLGVAMTLLLAGAVDLVIGLALLRALSPARWAPSVVAAAGAGFLVLLGMLQWGLPDRLLQSAGVFRFGKTDMSGRELLFYRDGATASISVVKQAAATVISTNGKPDAGLRSLASPPTSDEITMLILGALPLAVHPDPKDIAVIGWGSGLSTHTLLGSPLPKRVDSIEIEKAMWEGAWTFAERNGRAYIDPRSQVHFEDAREFFARGQRRYDIVASEPSNPWVSGVASLFTQEFYQGVKRSLKPGGMLVQWIHGYEISDALLAEMIAALLKEFPDSELYTANPADLIIVAPLGKLQPPSGAPWAQSALAAELRRVGLAAPVDLSARRLGSAAMLRTYVRLQNAKPHSDFFPTVSLFGPQQRFRGSHADLMMRLASGGLPVLQVLDCQRTWPAAENIQPSPEHPLLKARQEAVWAAERFSGRGPGQPHGAGLSQLVDGLRLYRQPGTPMDGDAMLIYAANLAGQMLAHVPAVDQQALWDPAEWRKARPDLPPNVEMLLRLFEATTRKDWPTVEKTASAILDGAVEPIPVGVKEQALVLSMLAGLAQGQQDVVKSREARWGGRVPFGAYADQRRFIKAWEEGREPVCAARTPGVAPR
ncbi:fused MFS/spermidine synthase [Roseateles sp. NT4]|uniref:fused MFS/spermidine synthase n=1 Tax=Roseateles sp. NT4 TaxID=3453715 RepID=UPI003EEAAD4D